MATDEVSDENSISSDERNALLSIAHGAVVTGGGVSIQRLLWIAIEVVLTRGLGPQLYGVYAFGWQLIRMTRRFANLGSNRTLLRDLSAFTDAPERQRRSLGLAYVTTAVTAVTLAVAVGLLANWINDVTIDHPDFPLAMRLFAVLLVLLAFVRIHAAALRAAKAANGEVLLNRVLQPSVRLAGAAVAMALGYSVVGVVGVLVITIGLLAMLAYPVTISAVGIRPTVRGLRSEARHFYDHAVPSALSGIGGLLRTRVDVLLIGVLLTATAAGIYNVVLVLVGLVTIPLWAFNQMLPPVASELYSKGKSVTLNRVYTAVTRLIVTATVPFVITMAVFGSELLTIFGPEYQRGYAVLLVFLVGRFIGNAVGATGLLLSMTNHQYSHMTIEWVLAILNVVLTYLFVVQFGLIGAALGTSLAIGVQNLCQLTVLWRFEGLWPYDETFLKPLAAGLGMGGIMVSVRAIIDGWLSVGIGILVGLVTFAALLVVFGINPRDRFVVRELVDQYHQTVDRGRI